MDYGEILQGYKFEETNCVTKVEVSYAIVSMEHAFDPNIITETTGIKAMDSWTKGQTETRISKKNNEDYTQTRINSLWRIKSGIEVESYIINDHIKYILSVIEPAKHIFQDFCRKEGYNVVFHIYRKCRDYQTFFNISSEYLTHMGEMCNEIEFLCPVE